MIQFVQHVQEMPDISCDAVKRCDEHDVEAVSPSICYQLVESWSLRLRARNYVGVLAHDFVSALLRRFAEVEQLCFEMLVASAHPCVDNGAFLHFNSFFLEIRYASMARRTNSATGAPVFSDSFWSFSSCCSFKNKAVRFISQYGSTQAYMCPQKNSRLEQPRVNCGKEYLFTLTCRSTQPNICPNGGIPISNRPDRLALPDYREAWWRWYGCGLQSGGPQTQSLCRPEIPARRCSQRPSGPGTLRARGAGCFCAG